MQYFVDHYGEAFLYAVVLLLVLVMVLPSGGVMGQVGNSMTSWQDTDGSGYIVYMEECSEGYPVVAASQQTEDALTIGTYKLTDLISAKDAAGNDARLKLLGVKYADGEWQECDQPVEEIAFQARGIYTLRVEARDGKQRAVIKEIKLPVNGG